jgi:hypothetical protein
MADEQEIHPLLRSALAAHCVRHSHRTGQNFVVYDLVSEATPSVRVIGLRNFVAGGFRELPLSKLASGNVRNASALQKMGLPLLVVAESEDAYFKASHPDWSDDFREVWKDTETHHIWLDEELASGEVRFNPTGALLEVGSAILDAPVVSFKNATLPATVTVRRSGAPDSAELRLSLRASESSSPLEGWFQLPDNGSYLDNLVLEVDAVCRWDRPDSLVAKAADNALYRISSPDALRPATLQRIGIVFDRTALDGQAWLDGLRFAQGDFAAAGGAAGGGFFDTAQPAAAADTATSVINFNEGLRRAMQAAVDELAAKGVVNRFSIATVVDQPTQGLASPPSFTMPDRHVFDLKEADGRSSSAWLATQTYSPGLDVWDPVEVALEEVLYASPHPDAIVVVTASPPNPPPDLRDPFAQYFAKTFTSGRDGSPPSLRILLEAAAEKGIPVACIWLTHMDAPVPLPPDLQGPFQRFLAMQQEIRETYRKYPYLLNFDSSASDADGVKQALLRTVQLLAARVSARFWVVQ